MTKEEVYDSQINPLMAQIITICREHKIPMLATFTLDVDEGLHCTSALLHEEWKPSEDILAAAREIIGGPPRTPMTLTTKNNRGETTAIEVIL